MNIKPGELITISHYSRIKPFKGYLLSTFSGIHTLKSSIDTSLMSLLEGDPLVIGYQNNDRLSLVGALVSSQSNQSNIINVCCEYHSSPYLDEIPVSLYAECFYNEKRARFKAVIKSMGVYSMVICSDEEINFYKNFDIGVYLDKMVLFASAEIAECNHSFNHFEYTLYITHMDLNSRNVLRHYLNAYLSKQKQMLISADDLLAV